MTEEVVEFRNRGGMRLFGIVHVPAEEDRMEARRGINLLNPGVKHRVAPHRLNVKLARELCKRGYYVLRFDPEGIGDSEGEIAAQDWIANVWSRIQEGLFVGDVICSNEFFVGHYSLTSLSMIGNCGGAITALLSTEKCASVERLVLIDLPITMSGNSAGPSYADNIRAGGKYSHEASRAYLRNVRSLSSWYRLLTLQSDYSAIVAAVGHTVRRLLRRPCQNRGEIKALNPRIVPSLKSYLSRGKRVLFILAEKDPNASLFLNSFIPTHLARQLRSSQKYDMAIIKGANHIYTLQESQGELFRVIIDWLGV